MKCKSDQGPAPRITNPKSLLSSFCLSNCDEDVWVLLFLLPKVEEWFILSMTSWLCSAPHLRQDRWRKLEGLSAREWKILLFLSKGNSILQQQCTKEIKRLAFMLIRINTEIGFVRFQLFLFKAFFFFFINTEFWIFNSFTLNIRSKYHTFIVLQILTSPQKSNLRWSYDEKNNVVAESDFYYSNLTFITISTISSSVGFWPSILKKYHAGVFVSLFFFPKRATYILTIKFQH